MTTPAPRPIPTLAANSLRAKLSALGVRPASQKLTDQPVLLIGSRRDCDLYVNHAEVSKVHAAVVNTGESLVVVDLSSRGGTYVNGQRVSAATLRRGDRLAAACVDLEIEWVSAGLDAGAPCADELLTLAQPLMLSGDGVEYAVRQVPAIIGRRQASTIQLDTPDVSLAHALIFVIDGRPVVADLESRSGTFVNRDAARLSFLCDGDELSIGGVRLKVASGGASTDFSAPVAAAVVAAPAAPAPAVAPVALAAPREAASSAVRASAAAAPAAEIVDDEELEDTIRDLREYLDRIESQLRVRRRRIAERESELEVQCTAAETQRRDLEARSTEFALRIGDVERREEALRRGEETIADASRRLEQFRSALFETSRSLGVAPRANA